MTRKKFNFKKLAFWRSFSVKKQTAAARMSKIEFLTAQSPPHNRTSCSILFTMRHQDCFHTLLSSFSHKISITRCGAQTVVQTLDFGSIFFSSNPAGKWLSILTRLMICQLPLTSTNYSVDLLFFRFPSSLAKQCKINFGSINWLPDFFVLF